MPFTLDGPIKTEPAPSFPGDDTEQSCENCKRLLPEGRTR